MIHLTKKNDCCGCGACAQRCPEQCISMRADEQGFLYPQTDEVKCIDCGLCERVCPMIQHGEPREPVATYAARHLDETIRLASSSGGAFTAIAEHVIAQDGVVFGARFNEQWDVVHDYTETIDGLAPFRGSKYVQSAIGDNFVKAEQFLKQGRQVLFTGTPCQIAGLKHFLRKDYDNLLTVEVACHGVPSPLVWQEYLKDKNPTAINFRDKRNGWKNYHFTLNGKSVPHDNDNFMGCFLENYSLRPACFDCQAKHGSSQADLNIADLWGISQIAPAIDDDRGTSTIIAWNEQGNTIAKAIDLDTQEIEFTKVAKHNPAIVSSTTKPSDHNDFWQSFSTNPLKTIKRFSNRHRPALTIRIKQKIRKFLQLK